MQNFVDRVPTTTALWAASADHANTVHPVFEQFFEHCAELDSDGVPTELRDYIKKFTNDLVRFAHAGGALGERTRIDEVQSDSSVQTTRDFRKHVPEHWTSLVTSPAISHIVELLNSFESQDSELFRDRGMKMREWLNAEISRASDR